METMNTTLSVIEDLMRANKESSYCYKKAAEYMEDPIYKRIFYCYAQYRAQFVNELEKEAGLLTKTFDSGDRFLEAMHRSWLDIKAMVADQTHQTILDECNLSETKAKKLYEIALEDELPTRVVQILQKQLSSILSALNKIKTLTEPAI